MSIRGTEVAPAIEAALGAVLAQPERTAYCVAFSGGIDSTALLVGMARLRAAQPQMRVRAVHVNHHLLPAADAWAEHCARIAAALSVPLTRMDVTVALGSGASPEAAARDARYRALESELQPEEVLLTAHHQEDQLETVLLQLLRGAGVAGLAAMPAFAPFGRGFHARPLLGVSRAALEECVREAGTPWIEDSSNTDLQYDRNYVRHRLLPMVRERWPAAAATVSRTARHFGEAQSLLDELARIDLEGAVEEGGLSVARLRQLPKPRARNLLRFWIRQSGQRPPSAVKLQEILRQMLESRPDAHPEVEWGGARITRRRDWLYLSS